MLVDAGEDEVEDGDVPNDIVRYFYSVPANCALIQPVKEGVCVYVMCVPGAKEKMMYWQPCAGSWKRHTKIEFKFMKTASCLSGSPVSLAPRPPVRNSRGNNCTCNAFTPNRWQFNNRRGESRNLSHSAMGRCTINQQVGSRLLANHHK